MPVTFLRFDPVKLQLAMLAAGVSAIGAVARMWIAGWITGQIGFTTMLRTWRFDIILPIWVAIALFLLYRLWILLISDRVAVKATEAGLEVRTFLKHRVVPWHGVLHTQEITSWYGPHRRKSFHIRYQQDGATHSLRVPMLLTERPPGGYAELPDRLEKAQAAATGRGPGATGSFDPDAAIQRYLANKASAPAVPAKAAAPPAPARTGGFGRRMVPPGR